MSTDTANPSIQVGELLTEEQSNRLRGAIFSLGYESVKEAANDRGLEYHMLIKQLNRRYVVTRAYVDQYREWLNKVQWVSDEE